MATELFPDHRCYHKPPEIIINYFNDGYGMRKYKWGVWVTDGSFLASATDVTIGRLNTYHKTIRDVMRVALELRAMEAYKDWPIALYPEGFDSHARQQIESDAEALQHVLAYNEQETN